VRLLEPSIFLQDYASLSFSGAASPTFAVDNDKQTLINSTQSDPTLTLDAGAGETRTASAVWLRATGYTAVSVQHGNPWTSTGSWTIPADGYLYAEFTEATSQHWRLNFTGTGGIYEVYLSKLLLDFDAPEKRPVWRTARHKGIFERAASGDLINFQPLGFGGGRADITLSWKSLDEASVALLRSVWAASVGRNLQFGVYPIRQVIEDFFQVRWESDFSFRYEGRSRKDGLTGQIILRERTATLIET